MTSADWNQIKTLLDEALERAADERAAFVNTIEEPAWREEVHALLAAHEQAEAAHALESPFANGAADEAEASGRAEGERIGPYRIVRELGRGGMGSVYLAERADGQFQQTVALKLIRRGLDTDDILSRFAFERQILAGLDHPNIARLYDGGMTDDGRPYFAMEYAEGESITDYCDRKRLNTPQRLALFRTVCRAIQHAHQNLIVHRDLKPSNILVTEEGEVKLLDFGIAKLLSDEGLRDGPTMPRTRTDVQILTPEYAAPEQVRGDAITTATDIYQLGVLLYELLTGRRPYRLDSRVQYEIIRVILEEEPERPSTAIRRADATTEEDEKGNLTAENISQSRATDPAKLQRRLAGDLDMICLTALKKEPERRYAGVEALAEDVRRHLAGLPVTAQPDTFGYRASRFVRRNRAGVAAASAVLLALIIGLGAALWQNRVAAAERDRATEALAQAEGTLDYLNATILAGGPYEGDPETPIGVVLDSAAAHVDEDLAGTPVVAASVHQTLSKMYLERGLPERAAHHARRARVQAASERDPVYARATVQLATALSDASQYEDALPFHREAVALLRQAGEREYALALNGYGVTLSDLNREEEAEQMYLEAIDVHRATNDAEGVLRPLNNLAVMYSEQGRYEEAVQRLREVIETMRATGSTQYHLATALINLAGSLQYTGEHQESLQLYQEGVQMLQDELGEAHPEAITAQVSLGNHYFALNDVASAQREAGAGLETAVQALGPDHFITAYAQNVAGRAYCEGGDPATGEPMLRASLTTRRGLLPAGHWLLANGESLLGGCLARLGRNGAAELMLKSGYEQLESDRGPEHQKTIEARDRLRTFYEATGREAQAAALGKGV